MRYVILGLIACLAFAVQTTLVDLLEVGAVGFHLPAMIAVAVALLLPGNGALVAVAAIGLLEDALSPGRLGIGMASYLLVGWILLEARERLDLERPSRRVLVTGLSAGFLTFAVAATRLALGELPVGLHEIAGGAAGTALCTAVAAIPYWFVLTWSEHAWQRRTARYRI